MFEDYLKWWREPRWFGLILCLLVLLPRTPAGARENKEKPVRDLEVTLNYRVDVESIRSAIFTLTALLPQSISGQQEISGMTFSPEPDTTFKRNGNTYAKWRLTGKGIANVIEVRFDAKIYQQNIKELKKRRGISVNTRRKLLKREDNINVDSRNIKKAASQIEKKNSDVEQVEEIYEYVRKHMKPAKAARETLGGAKALQKGKGDCTEYTDLMVTLARQLGLPARHVSGYIFGTMTGIPHSWAEIYTRDKGWMIVDALHLDLKEGNFQKHDNKYIAFSGIRNDPEIRGGMIYGWHVQNAKGARCQVTAKAVDKR